MHKHQPLPLDTIFNDAWKNVKGSKRSFFLTFFALVVSELLIYVIVALFEHGSRSWQGDLLKFVLLAFITAPLLAGLCMLGVNRFRNPSLHISDGFRYYRMLPRMIAAFSMGSIALWIAAMIVAAVLIIFAVALHMHIDINIQAPSHKTYLIFAAVTLLFYAVYKTFLLFNYILVAEKKVNPFLAWWKSCTMAWPHFGKIFLALIYLFVLNLFGICLLGLGLIWTIPFTYLVVGRIYLFCENEHNVTE